MKVLEMKVSQQAFNYCKSTVETLEKGVKYSQSEH